jgi:hypothetical protein
MQRACVLGYRAIQRLAVDVGVRIPYLQQGLDSSKAACMMGPRQQRGGTAGVLAGGDMGFTVGPMRPSRQAELALGRVVLSAKD